MTLVVAVLALAGTGTALADSTPVAPLPKPAVTKVMTAKGSLVAVALPAQPALFQRSKVWILHGPSRSALEPRDNATGAKVGSSASRFVCICDQKRGDVSRRAASVSL